MNQHNNKKSASSSRNAMVFPTAFEQRFLSVLLAWILTSIANMTNAAVITYDGSATPDSATLPFAFSWEVQPNTGWSAANGVLTMTTASGRAIWFGNEVDWRPPGWSLASSEAGNYVTVRVKLAPGSGQWQCYLGDGVSYAAWQFNADNVVYATSSNVITHPLDTTQAFHDYAFLLRNGQVTYSVDGVQLYSGPAPAFLPDPGNPRYFVIGDGSGNVPSSSGFGSFFVDGLTVITETDFMNQPYATIRVSEVKICWTSTTNASYRVEYRSSLTTNIWTTLTNCVPSGGSETCIYDKVLRGEPQRFYRVAVTNCVPGL
jgi:hypothetical protein